MKTICLKKALCSVLCSAALLPALSLRAEALNCPSAEDIRQFRRLHPFSLEFDSPPQFDIEPDAQRFIPGLLSAETQQEALNALNFVRFCAGLPADVSLSPSLSEKAQAAALLFFANGFAAHDGLPQPDGMDDALYELAADGAGHSNLSWDTRRNYSLIYGLLSLNMTDWDDGNLPKLGHRRWLLNPKMQEAGFGRADMYNAVYIFDKSRVTRIDYDYIAWPPAHMPYELYVMRPRCPFSVSLGRKYRTADIESLTVDIVSEKRGETLHLDKSNSALKPYDKQRIQKPEDDFFLTADNAQRGTDNTVIFNPGLLFDADDRLTVTIGGLMTKDGKPAELTYTVDFFALTEPARPGDADCSGNIRMADAVLTARLLSGRAAFMTQQGRENADADGSGALDAGDLACLLRMIFA